MEPIVQVSNLYKQFKDIEAVSDLSFTVNKGDIYGFLGQNGAGKSTTIRMLLSLVAPTQGKIMMFGKDLKGQRNEILQQVGAVIEKPDVYKYLTAIENLKLFAAISGGPRFTKQYFLDQLELVGLHTRANSKVKTFSQGMKQRLGIAIALVHNPQLMILDEPTNGLDPQGIADMRNLIGCLSRDHNKTIIVSSHLLSEIEVIANRILIIDKGKKIVEGSAAELFDPSKTIVELQTTDNLATFQILHESKWGLQLNPMRGKKILLNMHRQQVPQFNQWLVQQQIEVLLIHPRHSLEDYFLQVTTANQHVEAIKD